jgi:hypothetical protein
MLSYDSVALKKPYQLLRTDNNDCCTGGPSIKDGMYRRWILIWTFGCLDFPVNVHKVMEVIVRSIRRSA